MKGNFLIHCTKDELFTVKKDYTTFINTLGLFSLEDKISFTIDKDGNNTILLDYPISLYFAVKKMALMKMSNGDLQENQFLAKFAWEIKFNGVDYLDSSLHTLNFNSNSFFDSFNSVRQAHYENFSTKPFTYETILKTLVNNGVKDIIIGEGSHYYVAPKMFILQNIDYLKEIRAVVVIENLTYDTFQKEIDDCVSKKHYSELLMNATPAIEQSSLSPEAQELKMCTKLGMVKNLCENGIPIIAGDNEASNILLAGSKQKSLLHGRKLSNILPDEATQRLKIGNYVMIKNKEDYLLNHPKDLDPTFLYLTGMDHAINCDGVNSVTELVNGVSVILHDAYGHDAKSSIAINDNSINYEIIVKRNFNDLRNDYKALTI